MAGGSISSPSRAATLLWRALQKKAKAFEDTPNTVLRRVLRANGTSPRKGSRKRIARGEKTPQQAFRQAILQALYEKGGAGRTTEALDRIGEILSNKLTAVDRGRLGQGEIRWRNTAQWERNDMVTEGLLKKNSPHGIWELSEKGIKLAERTA